MRHNVAGRKLGRKSAHRLALFRNMAASLIEHGRIKTTLHKAKELKGIADKLVTIGKEDTLSARRRAFDFIRNRDAVQKLFKEIAPSFEGRHGGYTRIYKLGTRVGDAARMALIEYLHEDLLSAKVEGKVKDEKGTSKKSKVKKSAPKEAKTKEKPTKKVAAANKKPVAEKKTPKGATKKKDKKETEAGQ